MRIHAILGSLAVSGIVLGTGMVAKADTVPAHCDLYAPGDDYAYLSSSCTFSQRQGHIGIQLQSNGVRYDLEPDGGTTGNFVDQYGHAVYRQAGLGDAGLIFEFVDGSHLYVYWDAASGYGSAPSSSSNGIGTLQASDRGSQINIRSEASIYSRAVGYGLAGDRVSILECVQDTDTPSSSLNWCRVQFVESGTTGWIRSDFIIFPGDGAL